MRTLCRCSFCHALRNGEARPQPLKTREQILKEASDKLAKRKNK